MRMLALILALATASPLFAQEKPEELTGVKKIAALQKERIDALKSAAEASEKLYINAFPGVDVRDVMDDQLAWLKAELVTAEKSADRIAIYQKTVDALKSGEELAQVNRANARGTDLPILKFKARRLQVEAQMEREKLAQGKSPPNVDSANIKDLQKGRIATLKKASEVTEVLLRHAFPGVSTRDLMDDKLALLSAELETAEKPADRIAVYQKTVDVLKDCVTNAENKRDNARGTNTPILKYQARLLEVEIQLQQTKNKVQDNPKPKVDTPRIKELQKGRIATLAKLVDTTSNMMKNAQAQYGDVLEARLLLLKGELDAAEKETDRIAIYKKTVEMLKECEEYAQRRRNSARGTSLPILRFKAQRLETEILLEQAKLKESKEGKK